MKKRRNSGRGLLIAALILFAIGGGGGVVAMAATAFLLFGVLAILLLILSQTKKNKDQKGNSAANNRPNNTPYMNGSQYGAQGNTNYRTGSGQGAPQNGNTNYRTGGYQPGMHSQGGYQQGQPYQNGYQQGQPYPNGGCKQGQPYQNGGSQQGQPYQNGGFQQGQPCPNGSYQQGQPYQNQGGFQGNGYRNPTYQDPRNRKSQQNGTYRNPQQVDDLAHLKAEDAAALRKGREHLQHLRYIVAKLRNQQIHAQAEEICNVMEKILRTLLTKEDQIDDVRQFLSYYMPTLREILQKYETIESSGVNADNMTDKVVTYLGQIKLAMDKQYENLFEDDKLDLTVEMEAMTMACKQDGLLEDESASKIPAGEQGQGITLTL